MRPLISVIIPAYNSERYISDCVESVLNQTYKNLQVVIINDGSTDKTYEIAELYAIKDERIMLINTENGGVSRARNRGILESKGEYIIFVDSDDTLPLNSVELLFNDITENSADIAAGIMNESYVDESIDIWTGRESIEKYIQDNPFICV